MDRRHFLSLFAAASVMSLVPSFDAEEPATLPTTSDELAGRFERVIKTRNGYVRLQVCVRQMGGEVVEEADLDKARQEFERWMVTIEK